jgi:predicted dehydrogenase
VYISTPHGNHFQHVYDAIQSSRNVLVEKPAVMTSKQWQRLMDLAAAKGTVLMEAMWTRYFPLTRHLQDNVLPKIGPVRRILADYSVPLFGDPTLDPTSRFLLKSTGAGALLDLGVYPLTWVDIALSSAEGAESAGPLSVVYAETIEHETPQEPIDDVTTIVLSRREHPITAVVSISSSLPGSPTLGLEDKLMRKKNAPSIRIQGTKAEVAIPFPPIRPEAAAVQWYSPESLGKNGMEAEQVIKFPVYGWGLRYQADVLAKTLAERAASKAPAGSGLTIGGKGTLNVMFWADQARKHAGIVYPADIEAVW